MGYSAGSHVGSGEDAQVIDPRDMGDVELVAEYQRWMGMPLHPGQVNQYLEQRAMSVVKEFERRMQEDEAAEARRNAFIDKLTY